MTTANLCPKCGGEMALHEWDEDWDWEAAPEGPICDGCVPEDWDTMVCEECGYTEDMCGHEEKVS